MVIAAHPDCDLVHHVARVVGTPRNVPADSFRLHAPLELLARAALLANVRADERERARQRIADMAEQLEEAGRPVPRPMPWTVSGPAEAARLLAAALDRGDVDGADRAAVTLADVATATDLPALLGDAVVDRLAAAGHAPILLHLLPRFAPGDGLGVGLLRPLARELARHPSWRLTWQERLPAPSVAGTAGERLFEAVASTPALGVPGSTFIHPLLSQAEATGVAVAQLGPVLPGCDVAEAGRWLLRAAACSMLQEPGDHAPYGWTHCLTLPQAVLSVSPHLARPSRGLAIAATYVVAFRAALAQRPLRWGWAPPPVDATPAEALAGEPATAAAMAWHLPEGRRGWLVSELSTRASVHHDAHLVKYVLACQDAAAADPGAAHVFLAAAASLVAWWGRAPG